MYLLTCYTQHEALIQRVTYLLILHHFNRTAIKCTIRKKDSSPAALRGFAKKTISKNPRLLWKGMGGSRSHSNFLENLPKIALNQYCYFGVVYHMYSVGIYIAKRVGFFVVI